MTSEKKQDGSILLLALLILSSALLTGLTVATIILSEVRQSRNLDEAIISYHASSSGIEQALYYYRKDRASFDALVPEVQSGQDPAGSEAPCNFSSANFLGQCDYYHEKAASRSFPLAKGKIKQINLFNRNLINGYGVEYLEVSWWDETPGNGLEPWLEMEIVEIPNDWDGSPARETINLTRLCSDGSSSYPSGDTSGNTVSECGQWVEDSHISTSKNYKVRFRSLYDDVRVTVTARDGSDNIVGTGQIHIYANGAYRSANQALRAEVSDIGVTKGFADYVIFSDCDLVKGSGSNSLCP